MASLFADRIVGFFDVERDQTVGMPRQDAWSVGRIAQEVKHDPVFGVFADLGSNGQAKTEQLCNQAAFGVFDLPPPLAIVGIVERRNRAVQATRAAERFFVSGQR